MLEIPPVDSAQKAVRVQIVKDVKERKNMNKKRILFVFWMMLVFFILGCVELIRRPKGADTSSLVLNIMWIVGSLMGLVSSFIQLRKKPN